MGNGDPIPIFLVCKKYTKPWALHYSDIKQRLNYF